MTRYFWLLLLLWSCSTGNEGSTGSMREGTEAQGGRVYGGVLRLNETEPLQTLYPPSITDFVSNHIAAQIYETLIRMDTRDLSLKPALAEKWAFDQSGKIITFNLRKGVHFHDDDVFTGGRGREVTAKDVIFSLTQLCTYSPDNLVFPTTLQGRIKGATEHYEASRKGEPAGPVEGLKILDDYTFEMHLETTNPSILHILTQPSTAIVAPELVAHYGTRLTKGAGPFVFSDEDGRVVLVRNNNYYGRDSLGNSLPFLDSIVFTFISEKKAELNAFMEGQIDIVIGLPSESIKDMLERNISAFENLPAEYILDRSPELATHFYEFNTMREVFANKKVRQAFSYAIDRNKLVENVLKGEAFGPGVHGIVPPSLPGYDVSGIKGYNFEPEQARKLLAEAGYPNGRGFPSVRLELNSGGSKNIAVAIEIQRQLREVLNVNIDMDIVPFETKLRDAQYGRADLFRSAWIADYPSPETFLTLLYGRNVPDNPDEPSYPNVTRYKNAEFDRLFEMGLKARNMGDRYAYFALAEQRMMADAPILVLWYDEKFRIYQGDVKNYFSNPLNFWDFREVYRKAPTGTVMEKGG